MKKFLLLFALVFFNLSSVRACFESVSIASSVNNRYAGHQNQCRSLSITYKTNGSTPSGCFSVSGGGGVVRLSASSTGVCYYSLGEGSGSATVSVSGSCMCNGQGISKTVSFTFEEWGFNSITLSAGTLNPAFDDMHKSGQVYTATVSSDVDKITINAVANSSKSKVSGTGTFPLAVGENVFPISATTKLGRTTSYTIKITREKPKDITKMSFEKTNFELNVEDVIELKPIIEPVDADSSKITWSSDNKSVAIVDSSGTIEAVGAGNATVTVKSENGVTASVNIKVLVPVSSIKFSKQIINMNLNESQILNYTILPNDAYNKNVTFSSSDDTIVSVDQNGQIITKKYGKATITVVTEEGSFRSDCIVNVTEKKMESLYVNNKNIKIKKGETAINNISITPAEFQSETLIWMSSNPNIVSVDANGLLTANDVGTATIIVTNADKTLSTSFNVEVYKESNNLIYITIIFIISVPIVVFGIKKYKIKDE